MKLSELLALAQKALEQHGDLDIAICVDAYTLNVTVDVGDLGDGSGKGDLGPYFWLEEDESY